MTEFNKVWKIIQTLDSLMGNYCLVGPDQKLTIFQRFYHWMWLIGFSLPLFLTTSTVYMFIKSDISIAFQGIIITITYATAIIQNADILYNKQDMVKILEWCRKIKEVNNVHMNRARAFALKVIERITIIFACNWFFTSIGMIIVGQLLPNDIYSQYRPPQPFILPVEDRENWTIYIITTFMQCTGIFYGMILPSLEYTFSCLFITLFFAHLNTILDDIEDLRELTETWVSIGYNQNGKRFKRKLKSIVEKYCDGLDVFKTYSKWLSLFLLTTEFDAFIVLCYTGILIIIQSDSLITIGIGSNVITGFFYFLCLINDRIQTKLETINEAIYGLPWYGFSVEQRKYFLLFFQCNQINMGLHAGGLHQATLERFSDVVNAAYSNILVLKKLIEIQN